MDPSDEARGISHALLDEQLFVLASVLCEKGRGKPVDVKQWRWDLAQCYIFQAALQLHLARAAFVEDPWQIFLAAHCPSTMESHQGKRRGRAQKKLDVQGGPYGA